MKQAIALAVENVRAGRGGPFGALIVRDEQVIAMGVNSVTAANDPTAHAEVNAIRAACRSLGSFQLADCELYASCEPCPMCLGAIYWARLAIYYYSGTRQDAARAGFDDAFLHDQLALPREQRSIRGYCILPEHASEPFTEWASAVDKTAY